MPVYTYCMFTYLHRASWYSSATLTEVLPWFFLSYKANAWVKPAKTGHGPHSSKIFVSFCVLCVCVCVCVCVCKCVLYYCHRVATQFRLTNISISISQNLEERRKSLYCVSVETLKRLVLLPAICRSTIKKGSRCCVLMATLVTRTRYNIMLYCIAYVV